MISRYLETREKRSERARRVRESPMARAPFLRLKTCQASFQIFSNYLPCDIAFEDYEWKSLYCFVHRTRKPPQKPPTLGEAIKLVARVGGFLARKGDGAPGPTVLWRGLQELATISFAWFAFGPERSVH